MKIKNAFALLELLLAIGILAVIMGLSFPSWSHWLEKNRVDNAVVELMRMLKASRQMAIEMNDSITVCPSKDNRTCEDFWEGPYVIVKKRNEVLISQNIGRISLQWRSNLKRNKKLIFEASGKTAGQQGHFLIQAHSSRSHAKNPYAKKIVVLMGGVIYSQ